MKRRKNSAEILRLRSLIVKCKNCSKKFNKYRFGSYDEPRKFCCHKCATDFYKENFPQGKKHHLWKGKKASYITQHQWINRNCGKANKCEDCNVKRAKRYHWANISGKYKRNVSDYKQLCVSCHLKYDHLKQYGDKCRNGHTRPPENERISKYGWKECRECAKEKYYADQFNILKRRRELYKINKERKINAQY